jgi:hypothetical protein
MVAVPSKLATQSRMMIYYAATGVWSVFLILSSYLFYRFRQHPAIQHRDVSLTMVCILASAAFSIHYLVKIPLEGHYPCALYLWIPIIFMPLWLMTLLARLTRIIAAYRLGEARLKAVEFTQPPPATTTTTSTAATRDRGLSSLSSSPIMPSTRHASLQNTVKKLLRSSSAHEPMIDHSRDNSSKNHVVKKKASHSTTTNYTLRSDNESEECDPWPINRGTTPSSNTNGVGTSTTTTTTTSIVVDPDRAYATITSPRSAHWTFVYRQHLTTPSLVRMIVVLEVIILIGAVFVHYIFREALLHQPDGTCGSTPVFTYIWAVAGLYLVVLTPILLYAARNVRDAWGIRNELVLCDIIGIISCLLYFIFRIYDWDDQSVWPATLWILLGTAFTHIWTVARPAIHAACDLRDIHHAQSNPIITRSVSEMNYTHHHHHLPGRIISTDIIPRARRIPSSISNRSLMETPHTPSFYIPLAHHHHSSLTDSPCLPPPSSTSISQLNVYRDRITSWQPTPSKCSNNNNNNNDTTVPMTLDTILACPNLLSKFRSFCMYDLSLEALLFYETVIRLQARIIGVDRLPRYDSQRTSVVVESSSSSSSSSLQTTVTRQSFNLFSERSPVTTTFNNYSRLSPTVLLSRSGSAPTSSLSPSFNMMVGSVNGGGNTASGNGNNPMAARRPSPPLSRAAITMQLRNIIDAFIRPGAPYEITISHRLRERLLLSVDRMIYPQVMSTNSLDNIEAGQQPQQPQCHRESGLADLYLAAEEIHQQLEQHSVVRFRQEYRDESLTSDSSSGKSISRWRRWLRIW